MQAVRVGGVDLERVGAVDIVEIAKQSPNVTLEVSRGTNTTLTAFIRGVGQQDPVAGFESGVGLYVDDVYRSRQNSLVNEMIDIEAVEVFGEATLIGNEEANVFEARAYADVIVARGGDDTVFSGSGNDTVYGGDGDDFIDTGPGLDNGAGNVLPVLVKDAGHADFFSD